MVSRVDRLLTELQQRHGNEAVFYERLRPMVERIFEDETPEEQRVHLLELVAETCDREQANQRNFAAAQESLREYTQRLLELVRRLGDRRAG